MRVPSALAAACLLAASAARADLEAPTTLYRVPTRYSLAAPYETNADEGPVVIVPARPHLVSPPWRHQLADLTDVASGEEPGKRLDLRFSAAYRHTEARGQVKRELDGAYPGQATRATYRDLRFARSRDELALRGELGIFHDLSVFAELPIVLYEQTDFSYDGTTADNSTTVRDSIVPKAGYDAIRGGTPTGGSALFRGVRRGAASGHGADAFDTFDFGLRWAPLSQRRDPTKPTWVLGIEPHISIGSIRRFDPTVPGANHGVADGVHRVVFNTAASRRIGRFEPYVSLSYLLPIARVGSAYVDYGSAEKANGPQHQVQGIVGTEIIAYERGRPDWRVAIDLRAHLDGHFQGRGYSDAWEIFAGSTGLACDSTHVANPACDPATGKNPYQAKPFSGLTVIEGYATIGLEAALDARLARWFRLRAAFAYSRDQSHLITGDSSGVPSTPGGKVIAPTDYNPAYRPVIDQPGRRYLVDNVDLFDVKLLAQARF
ncbi:MAG: hypothetical protein ABI321_09590 [Polyangia bacterium]